MDKNVLPACFGREKTKILSVLNLFTAPIAIFHALLSKLLPAFCDSPASSLQIGQLIAGMAMTVVQKI